MHKKNLTIKEVFTLAVQNHQKKNLKIAENFYQEVLKRKPNHANANNNLGILFQELGEFQKAKIFHQKTIQIEPNHAKAYNNLGAVFQELGDYKKAISCYQKAIEIQPSHANTHDNLGMLFQELGEFQKAKISHQKTIQIEPNHIKAYVNLGNALTELKDYQKAISYFQKALKLKSNLVGAQANIAAIYITQLNNLEKAINESCKALTMHLKSSKFINQRISLYRLKHDVQQAEYLNSKNYKINGIDKFQKVGNEILRHKENGKNDNNSDQEILLNHDEINSLLPFYKANLIYQTSIISENCINPYKNWREVEEQYFNSSKQIMYIDNFLSDVAIKELREFCLISKIWNREYGNKYLGAFSNRGFISPILLKIAIELKQKLPKLFGKHRLGKFWAFKYDSVLGKGINIHADFALLNLNFWITPDEYNNNKNSGGLKVYDAPAPDDWTFLKYNRNTDEIYKFLNDNNANCTNIPYKFNRAVLFNSAYFHETDKINFKEGYEARRINITYLFGNRLVKKMN